MKNEQDKHTVDSTPVVEVKVDLKKEDHQPKEFEDDDPVTVVVKNWGASGVVPGHTSYIDRVAFVGGVARNVPYHVAKKWQKSRIGIHVLPNNATESDFIRITGRRPMSDHDLSTQLKALDPDKVAALLTEDQISKIAAFHAHKKGA
jgi:hypothetical protein